MCLPHILRGGPTGDFTSRSVSSSGLLPGDRPGVSRQRASFPRPLPRISELRDTSADRALDSAPGTGRSLEPWSILDPRPFTLDP